MPRLLPFQVSVETDRPIFPSRCICCLEDAETEYRPTPPPRSSGMPEGEDELLIYPYCEVCLAHVRASQKLTTANLVGANMALWGVVLLWYTGPFVVAGPALAGIYLVGNYKTVKPALKAVCASAGLACRVIWYRRNSYIFSFAHEAYASEFRAANSGVLTPETVR